jgi:hypothetical protein
MYAASPQNYYNKLISVNITLTLIIKILFRRSATLFYLGV